MVSLIYHKKLNDDWKEVGAVPQPSDHAVAWAAVLASSACNKAS